MQAWDASASCLKSAENQKCLKGNSEAGGGDEKLM